MNRLKRYRVAGLCAAALLLCSACGEAGESGTSPKSSREVLSEASGSLDEASGNAGESAAGAFHYFQEQIVTVTTFDGLAFDGKLRLPEEGTAEKLVIYVNGSGPNTYDNHREIGGKEVNYHDLFAGEFTRRGIAYFSYNTRGVTPGATKPYFADIDDEAYLTYKPSNQMKDIGPIIDTLKALEPLKQAGVYLLGWSEGTLVAPLAVREGADVQGLLLAGYMNGSMAQTLEWQQTGGSSMVFYRQCFDYDGSGDVSAAEFEEDRGGVAPYLGVDFAALDADGDGLLTEADFALLLQENREAVMKAFNEGDDIWLAENYPVRVTSGWFRDFATLPANRELLPELDLPIHIFHGVNDANIPVQDVYDIEAAFDKAGKTNLTVHVFDNADHDLNYAEYAMAGTIPEGIKAIFEAVQSL